MCSKNNNNKIPNNENKQYIGKINRNLRLFPQQNISVQFELSSSIYCKMKFLNAGKFTRTKLCSILIIFMFILDFITSQIYQFC